MAPVLTEIILIITYCFVWYVFSEKRHSVQRYSNNAPLSSECFCLLPEAKPMSIQEKGESKEDIISQICWGSGNSFCNWNGSSPRKSNKCGFYPKHMAGSGNQPTSSLRACLGTQFTSHIEYLSGFKKYFIYRGKMPFGFPEGDLERYVQDHRKMNL